MKMMIVISCIMAMGQHLEPRGHYNTWSQCNVRAVEIEKRLKIGKKNYHPLCWCHKKYPKLPYED